MLVESANSLFRVFCFDESTVDAIAEALRALGCVTEYFKARNMLAASVRDGDALPAADAYLNRHGGAGGLNVKGAIYCHEHLRGVQGVAVSAMRLPATTIRWRWASSGKAVGSPRLVTTRRSRRPPRFE